MLNKVAKLSKYCLISPLSPVYPLCLCVLVASRITNTVLSAQGVPVIGTVRGRGTARLSYLDHHFVFSSILFCSEVVRQANCNHGDNNMLIC